MGDWQTIKQALIQWAGKYFVFIVYIIIGIVVQLAMYDRSQMLSKWQRFWRIVTSMCAGAIASFLCNAWHWDKVAMLIVPMTTLIGQSLFEYCVRKWPLILDFLIEKWTKYKADK